MPKSDKPTPPGGDDARIAALVDAKIAEREDLAKLSDEDRAYKRIEGIVDSRMDAALDRFFGPLDFGPLEEESGEGEGEKKGTTKQTSPKGGKAGIARLLFGE